MGNRPSRLVFGLFCLALAGSSTGAFAADCLDQPVHLSHWKWVGLAISPEFVGDWRMNVSASNAILTRVHTRVEFTQPAPGVNWIAQIEMTYPSNPPAGIPYTFQKVSIQYDTPLGSQTAEIDWTRSCASPGQSVYPGQSFGISMELPGTSVIHNLQNTTLSIWGSEN